MIFVLKSTSVLFIFDIRIELIFTKTDLIQKTSGIFLTVLTNKNLISEQFWLGCQSESIDSGHMSMLRILPDVHSKGWPAPPPS